MRRPWLAAALLLAVSTSALSANALATLDAFHKALREKAAEKALGLLAVEAVIYEQGFAEVTRKEWAGKQLGAAVMFASDSERRILSREVREVGDAAWVLSTTRTMVGVAEGKSLRLDGAETAILRRQKGEWKIVHLHWSAHETAPESTTKP